MQLDLSGKRAIICGGSRGIGRAIALAFAQAGAGVSICARGAEALEATRKDIAAYGHTAHAASCDLSQADAIKAYIAGAAAVLGRVDILVNNASGFGQSDDQKGWDLSYAVDVMATVHASHAAIDHLKAAKGCIINISSISALRASARSAPYGAAKAAVIHYTLSQAQMYARDGVRANAISPGSIEFPGGVWDQRKTSNPGLYNAVLKSIPFGRLGHPEEIANVALFLASPLAAWVTGQAISVDGGQLL
ncbi:MAG: SDR family oxidoreductase [Acetobacteraceae bacterium]|nr:SDR family oxidoreductase [Acetobacteraceae bacterium]